MAVPYFVIDEARLNKNLELIKSIEKEADVTILLAQKAFSFWPAFDIFKKFGFAAAASSYNEARLCFEELGKKAHTFSTVFYQEEFEDVCQYSSHIIFNSLNQFRQFKKEALRKNVSMGLRVNPEWSDVKIAIYNPASSYSRLGVTEQTLGDFWDDDIEGLHFHVLCESDSYSFETAFKKFEERFGHLLGKLKWLNFGGGHLITDKKYDVQHLISLLKAIKEKYDVDIYLEPGAAFVWQAGELVAQVMDIVNNGDKLTACLNVSFTCHMPDTLEMPYKPKVLGEVEFSEYAYMFGGTSCLAGDYVDGFYFEKPLKIGDEIVLQDMIEYTLVKTTFFNGINHPSVYVRRESGKMELLRKYTFEDFKRYC